MDGATVELEQYLAVLLGHPYSVACRNDGCRACAMLCEIFTLISARIWAETEYRNQLTRAKRVTE